MTLGAGYYPTEADYEDSKYGYVFRGQGEEHVYQECDWREAVADYQYYLSEVELGEDFDGGIFYCTLTDSYEVHTDLEEVSTELLLKVADERFKKLSKTIDTVRQQVKEL